MTTGRYSPSVPVTLHGAPFSWDPARERILVAAFPRLAKNPLPEFVRGSCTIDVEVPPNLPVNSFSIRFLDSDRRTFQWRLPVKLRVRYFNPLPHELSIECRMRPSAGMLVTPAGRSATLKPGEKREAIFKVQTEQTSGDTAWIEQELKWEGGRETLRIPIKLARVIPQRRNGNGWDFVLGRRDQVKSLFDADPGNQDKLWRGSDDLSAKVRLAISGQSLLVDVDATDDRHVQPYRGENVYKGDNVQLALSIPGQNGMWVIGATCHIDGDAELFVWSAPAGFAEKDAIPGGRLDASRQGTRTIYRMEMPLASLGLTPSLLSQGIRFNLIVNDNDGYGRKAWIQIADGLAANRSDLEFPVLCFETADPE